ncbi:hypothetical protein ACIRPK_22930 [Kitasatospora sp. NPDC101801]|uniref:hypothetical protein n=1 Tax=Kitasatospora sp. NPDC101801 TaxID=3364103 RepID=UPI003803C97D
MSILTRLRTVAAAVLVLTLLTSCGPTADSTKDTSLRIATEDQIRAELKQASDRAYQALGVKGRLGQSEAVNFSGCEDHGGSKDARDAIHFWQVDDLDPVELNPAVERLQKWLKDEGWGGLGDQWDANRVDHEVWGKNPEKTVAVWAQSFRPMNRIIFRVSAACFQPPAS